MNLPKISGCIVTYNNSSIIEKTIRSLLENTKNTDFHLYIVDNASSDGTAELVRKAFPSVTVIDAGGNLGYGAGHNLVLPLLDSDFHAVINPDIRLNGDTLSELAAFMLEHNDAGLLSPRIVGEDGTEQLLGKRNPTFRYLAAHRRYHAGDAPTEAMREYCMLDEQDKGLPFPISNATGCFMFFRTSVFKSLGGFDERFFMYLEDCDIARRAAIESKALFIPGISVCHLWARESKTNKKLLLIHIESIIKYFLKWAGKNNSHPGRRDGNT